MYTPIDDGATYDYVCDFTKENTRRNDMKLLELYNERKELKIHNKYQRLCEQAKQYHDKKYNELCAVANKYVGHISIAFSNDDLSKEAKQRVKTLYYTRWLEMEKDKCYIIDYGLWSRFLKMEEIDDDSKI